jgi:hypothetical protein
MELPALPVLAPATTRAPLSRADGATPGAIFERGAGIHPSFSKKLLQPGHGPRRAADSGVMPIRSGGAKSIRLIGATTDSGTAGQIGIDHPHLLLQFQA